MPNHQSIDTYAKKLYIIGENNKYLKLKVLFSCFLIWEQLKNPTDVRYDSFFASILGSHATDFRGDIKIVSWNYDFQFEKAYSVYLQRNSLSETQNYLGVFPSNAGAVETYKLPIFKLNGTTGFTNTSDGEKVKRHTYNAFDLKDEKELAKRFLWFFIDAVYFDDKVYPLLRFAWDERINNYFTQPVLDAEKSVKGSKVLVIVGYSIPFFNREIDRKIITSLLGIEKLYIQDKQPEVVLSNFESIWPADFPMPKTVLKSSVEQFFLPPEL